MAFLAQRFDIVHSAPAWLSMHERVLLYGLVGGLQPERILEIGTFQGGATRIMCAALDDLGSGSIVCVDPNPRVAAEHWEAVRHRATMVSEGSPEGLDLAATIAGGGFDLALIDGDHSKAGVQRDLEATLPKLSDEAHLLFHDAHYVEVQEAIDEAIARHPDELSDAGLISVDASLGVPDGQGQKADWGGLRMLRFRRGVDAEASTGGSGSMRRGRSRLIRAARDSLGRRLHGLIDRRIQARLEQALPALEERFAAERNRLPDHARVIGPPDRVAISPGADVSAAVLDTRSGRIVIGAHAIVSLGAMIVTGAHDADRTGAERVASMPSTGRDVVVEEGAWIAARAVVLGPCRIGADAVVAAGAVVTGDVPAGTVVAGVPARAVRRLPD
jgi:acetyltransferase-like isoleucine patch superfamily enzyme/predicted O-methyltransferase YrrM